MVEIDFQKPLVSIIIPCRNEEKFIDKCLDSILAQDYPKEKLEILIVDGISTDNTRTIVSQYMKQFSFLKLIDNHKKITPVGMNIGIENAMGEYIAMVNAHSVLGKDFIKLNVYYLNKIKDADAVGGKLTSISCANTEMGLSIAIAVDSVFATGGNRYRTNRKSGFVQDTLPYCFYRRDIFKRFGYIDERLIRAQDGEFNLRLLAKGGKIFFTPEISSFLCSRLSLSSLWKQHFQYGRWKVRISEKLGLKVVKKQTLPAIFMASLFFSGLLGLKFEFFAYFFWSITFLYLSVNLLFSFYLASKNKFKYFSYLPIIFIALHFSYGLGFIKGIIDFRILRKNLEDLQLSR